MNSTYGNINITYTTYTSGLPGPVRSVYPTEKLQENELLSSLALVMFPVMTKHSNYDNESLKGSPQYDAYEKDIAVVNLYFGDSTVFGITQ